MEEDPNHIPAVCVEQDTDRLNVLIAINKAKWCDGDSILHGLESGSLKNKTSDNSHARSRMYVGPR